MESFFPGMSGKRGFWAGIIGEPVAEASMVKLCEAGGM
jgi:hypothetical protein